jgi:hypothetical protein
MEWPEVADRVGLRSIDDTPYGVTAGFSKGFVRGGTEEVPIIALDMEMERGKQRVVLDTRELGDLLSAMKSRGIEIPGVSFTFTDVGGVCPRCEGENPIGCDACFGTGVERKCNRCGKERASIFDVDPFAAEGISGDPNKYEWWCEPCISDRRDEV